MRALLTIAGYVAGFALAMSLLAHFSGYGRLNGAVVFVWFCMGMGLGWLGARILLKRAHEVAASPLKLAVHAACCAAVAAAAYHFLPVSAYQFPKVATLKVMATGQRNPASKGTEVWAKVVLPNGRLVKPRAEGGRGWTRRDDGVAMSAGTEPAAIAWDIKINSGAILQLTRHAWSGMAEVAWAGRETAPIDLYSESNDATVDIRLSGAPRPSVQDRRLAALVGTSDVVSLTMMLLLLTLVFLKENRMRSKG